MPASHEDRELTTAQVQSSLPCKQTRNALKALRQPLPNAYLRDLRAAHDDHQRYQDITALLAAVTEITAAPAAPAPASTASSPSLRKEDLHLVCWEYIWS